MEVSQIIYKVDNLEKTVEKVREKGFEVEYGKKKSPYNALIYFSNGPYIELLKSSGVPKFAKFIMKFIGYGKLVEIFDYWDNADPGFIGLALEKDDETLLEEKNYLKNKSIKSYTMSSCRKDTHGLKLKYKCLFPANLKIPFIMTKFKQDPRKKNFIHKNGAKEISYVSYGTDKEYIHILMDWCNDGRLKLNKGNGISDVIIKDCNGINKSFFEYLK